MRNLTIAQQAFALRSAFPNAKAELKRKQLVWLGQLEPTPLSRKYSVQIKYVEGSYPKVYILDQFFTREDKGILPHVYDDGSICLYEADQWNCSMSIVDTIVPWTAEWLAHYELWRVNECWYGDRTSLSSNQSPSDEYRKQNRAQRRRYGRG